MKEIIKFTGPATGLWICGPLMSLIDTAVIGQGSSIELAALGTIDFYIFLIIIVVNCCYECRRFCIV
jgi:Na+-driven multidrug efflux pump